jgi:hypothetical protein
MPRKVLTTVVPDPREDGAIQVEVMLPVRQQRRTQAGTEPRPESLPRIPRISRLMALAIKFREMVDSGTVRDYADLARLGYVTRARITQIMNLLLLAPDIQEHLLFLYAEPGAPLATERELRTIATRACWEEQRKLWNGLAR